VLIRAALSAFVKFFARAAHLPVGLVPCWRCATCVSNPRARRLTDTKLDTLLRIIRIINLVNGVALGISCFFAFSVVTGMQTAFLAVYLGCVRVSQLLREAGRVSFCRIVVFAAYLRSCSSHLRRDSRSRSRSSSACLVSCTPTGAARPSSSCTCQLSTLVCAASVFIRFTAFRSRSRCFCVTRAVSRGVCRFMLASRAPPARLRCPSCVCVTHLIAFL
jgi:hypothetical protein